jgi:hypothetical protein
MIDMHVYLLEKYRPPFLHGVFFFSKVGVLVVNFDGFFILAYSSHIILAGPLEGFCCSFLYLKGLSTLPDIFRKGIMEPTLPCVFDCPPA